MKPDRWVRVLAAIALLLALGCSDGAETAVGVPDPHASVSARQPAPGSASPQALRALARAPGLLLCSPLPAESVTTTIGTDGGFLDVGPHRLTIPPGALDAPQQITAVARVGVANLVRFQPAGLRFARAAFLKMSYGNCVMERPSRTVQVAYVTDSLQILEYLVVDDQPPQRAVTGRLWHFSNYAVAW